MSVRWECPNGCPAVLGPKRPRRDNVVRFCLACSAKAGRLVPRSSPVVERERSASRERSAEKQARNRRLAAQGLRELASAESAKWFVEGVDMRDVAERMLPFVGLRRLPRMRIVRGRLRRTSGTSYGGAIVLRIPDGGRLGVACWITLHELCHEALPRFEEAHGVAFKRLLIDATEAITGERMDKQGTGWPCKTVLDPSSARAFEAWVEKGMKWPRRKAVAGRS